MVARIAGLSIVRRMPCLRSNHLRVVILNGRAAAATAHMPWSRNRRLLRSLV